MFDSTTLLFLASEVQIDASSEGIASGSPTVFVAYIFAVWNFSRRSHNSPTTTPHPDQEPVEVHIDVSTPHLKVEFETWLSPPDQYSYRPAA